MQILGNELATFKLMFIHFGISVNFSSLYKEISGYPDNYRVKRSKKKIGILNDQLFDLETEEYPFIPEEFYISDKSGEFKSVVKMNYKETSPFKLLAENGEAFIFCNELNIKIKCSFSSKLKFKNVIINNFPLYKYIQIIGADRIAFLGFEGCNGFFNKTSCLFCDSAAKRLCETGPVPSVNDLNLRYSRNIDKWLADVEKPYIEALVESYKYILKEDILPHKHLHVMSGNLYDVKKEWEYIFRITKALNNVYNISNLDSFLNLIPIDDEFFSMEAKNFGYKHLVYNIEVWGEKFYNVVCKGKSDLIKYNDFLKSFNDGVKYFGSGNVRCGFVLGAQDIKETKKGVLELADMGVATDFTVFTPKKGTIWENKEKPNINDVANFSVFVADIYKSHNFKPLYCSLSSRSGIMNEVMINKKVEVI